MGAWGYGTYDNDCALDYVKDVLDDSFEGIHYVEQALVWLDMVKKFNVRINKYQHDIVRELILEDLDNITCWSRDCQDDREQLLNQYLSFLTIALKG